MSTYAFDDSSGVERLKGTLNAPDATVGDVLTVQADQSIAAAPGGGSQPVTCVLEVYPLDVHDGAAPGHDCLWNHLFDNPKDMNALAAIPAGLGLAFAFDGSDATIATAEAGTWAFTLSVSPPPDATWAGAAQIDGGFYVRSAISGPDNLAGVQVAVSETISVPAGYSFVPQVFVAAGGTANPLNADVYLNIVRLA